MFDRAADAGSPADREPVQAFAAELDGIDQEDKKLARCCLSLSGTAILYRTSRGIIDGRIGDRLKRLKRKEMPQ